MFGGTVIEPFFAEAKWLPTADYFSQVGNYVFEAPVQFRRLLQMNFMSKAWPEFLDNHEKLLQKNGNIGHYVGTSVSERMTSWTADGLILNT